MSRGADIMTFLASRERCLELNHTPREHWARLLPSSLNETALAVCAAQSTSNCPNYDCIKSILLESFKATPGVYRKKLLSLRH